jgi:hypothetical protein
MSRKYSTSVTPSVERELLCYNDHDIHDLVQVAAYFNYINRIADGLGVAREPFMIPWNDRPTG